jgi:DNA-binding transcriptional MerR regulator
MLGSMEVFLTIGEFSKMTYLSVKALRHYHDVGLLEPAAVDGSTGYRHYTPDQVATAQAIRRFRDLDMPIDEVRQVLDAPDLAARNQAILVHLERMHDRLAQTQATVESLQTLLTTEPAPGWQVEIRHLAGSRVVNMTETVSFDGCSDWLEPALAALRADAERAGLAPGIDGALYPDEFFEAGLGAVTAFVSVERDGPDVVELPPVTVAVLVHEGTFADLDRTYGALGTAVAERGIGGPGPIREHYLTPTRTEVCWPLAAGST